MLTASRIDLQETLKSGGRLAWTGARQRVRSALVVTQVALSVTLLVSAGLLIESLYRLHQERLGFSPAGLTTFSAPLAADLRRNEARARRHTNTLLERFKTLPDVQGVAAINVLPLAGGGNFPAEREGHPEDTIGAMEIRAITPAYFEVMGIPMRQGRRFLDTDTEFAPPVLLVNETLKRQWWSNSTPLGDRIIIGRFRGRDYGKPKTWEIVGVAADTKTRSLKEPPRPTIYVPAAQMPEMMASTAWIVRATHTAALEGAIRQAIRAVDPRHRVTNIRPMEEIVASTTATSRFDAWLFGSLAGLALALSLIGIYGVLSFSVARRTSEIGTRMALGASGRAVLAMVLKQGAGLIVTGLIFGLAGAVAATRSLGTLLFGVGPVDPASFIAVSVLLLVAGLGASYFPARRATKVDPMAALREE